MLERCVNAKFCRQSIVSFIETTKEGDAGLKNHFPDLSKLSSILSYERNPNGQIYVQQRLHCSGHATFLTSDVTSRLFSSPSLWSSKKSKSKSEFVSVPYCHIPNNVNYLSHCKQFAVINNDSKDLGTDGFNKDVKFPIQQAAAIVRKMFQHGLGEYFKYDNRKRSSDIDNVENQGSTTSSLSKISDRTSKLKNETKSQKRKKKRIKISSKYSSDHESKSVLLNTNSLPVINLGWTLTDCHRYGDNQSTLAGTVKPFITKSNLNPKVTRYLVDVIETIFKVLPSETVMSLDSSGNEYQREFRRNMWREFKMSLGSKDRNVDYFRAEGITLLIPSTVGWHKDVLNCDIPGMDSVVSINVSVPICDETFPFGTDGNLFYQWLVGNGYLDAMSFPCSIIMYGRKPVGRYCLKLSLNKRLIGEDELVRKLLANALVNDMDSIVDYRSRIWNSKNYVTWFMNGGGKIRKSSIFKGKYDRVPASYDKMVSFGITYQYFYISITTIYTF